ncbi:hypothetical protein BMETH_1740_1 [methanotrophic bacterial endosymbiont of Bathymodiolus sp.]|nr:hypothetical protein BMETH_1740_1 [methanotrophic bacterial endosymbiont of Bathymodiolus sp.]
MLAVWPDFLLLRVMSMRRLMNSLPVFQILTHKFQPVLINIVSGWFLFKM